MVREPACGNRTARVIIAVSLREGEERKLELLRLLAIAGLVAALSLSGCSAPKDQGTVGIAVTDAPVDDYAYVNVTFSRAAIHKADVENGSGWIEIVNTTRTVDLLALHKNQTSQALGFAEVDAGRYTQVRVYIDKVEAVKKDDGSMVTMTVPSGLLRISKAFEVKPGGNTTLTLEVDLGRSISCTNSACRFSPVLAKVEAEETA